MSWGKAPAVREDQMLWIEQQKELKASVVPPILKIVMVQDEESAGALVGEIL